MAHTTKLLVSIIRFSTCPTASSCQITGIHNLLHTSIYILIQDWAQHFPNLIPFAPSLTRPTFLLCSSSAMRSCRVLRPWSMCWWWPWVSLRRFFLSFSSSRIFFSSSPSRSSTGLPGSPTTTLPTVLATCSVWFNALGLISNWEREK